VQIQHRPTEVAVNKSTLAHTEHIIAQPATRWRVGALHAPLTYTDTTAVSVAVVGPLPARQDTGLVRYMAQLHAPFECNS
jgi:hypothetical protein